MDAKLEDRFSQQTINVLRAAGWFEGRSVDIAPAIDVALAEGFSANPAAESVLREFSGLMLTITPLTGLLKGQILVLAHFLEGQPIATMEVSDIQWLARLTIEPACPVAWSKCGYVFVLPSGRVVKLDQDWLFTLTMPDIETFIEMICLEGEPPLPQLLRSRIVKLDLQRDQMPPQLR